MASLKPIIDGYRCSNCRMMFKEPLASCPFCHAVMANYEELIVKNFKDQELDFS